MIELSWKCCCTCLDGVGFSFIYICFTYVHRISIDIPGVSQLYYYRSHVHRISIDIRGVNYTHTIRRISRFLPFNNRFQRPCCGHLPPLRMVSQTRWLQKLPGVLEQSGSAGAVKLAEICPHLTGCRELLGNSQKKIQSNHIVYVKNMRAIFGDLMLYWGYCREIIGVFDGIQQELIASN